MQIPIELLSAIEDLSNSCSIDELMQAREQLTSRYRSKSSQEFMTTDAERLSYLITRLPATYAAIQSVFQHILLEVRERVFTLLDLGAGPGTGGWAACPYFPSIQSISSLEKDHAIMKMGIQLSKKSSYKALESGKWMNEDMQTVKTFQKHDLVLCSYSIGELAADRLIQVLDACWDATNRLLVIVEPGTPVGFERIRRMRQHLIERGAHMVAPCPHEFACPMQNGDWCHFATRVQRTSLHRKLKEGHLGHEDEKFSYVVFSRERVLLPTARIIRHPDKHSGHISLMLCSLDGIQEEKKSKKMGEEYKMARKAEWGDALG